MNCIICNNHADFKGSHIVPASLIAYCVGKRNYEESYNLDTKTIDNDVFFGASNLKNESTEIKTHPHTKDHILCKECEKRLGELEGKFSTEFLRKYKEDRYSANFKNYVHNGIEIVEPKRLSNIQIHAYFYSIILRICKEKQIDNEEEEINEKPYVSESELDKIRKFLYGFLYENNSQDYVNEVADFRLAITFDKNSEVGTCVGIFPNMFNRPRTFFLCQVYVSFFAEQSQENELLNFDGYVNDINSDYAKIRISPDSFDKANELIITRFVRLQNRSYLNDLCKINGKSYHENLIELIRLSKHYQENGIDVFYTKAQTDLMDKYEKQV